MLVDREMKRRKEWMLGRRGMKGRRDEMQMEGRKRKKGRDADERKIKARR